MQQVRRHTTNVEASLAFAPPQAAKFRWQLQRRPVGQGHEIGQLQVTTLDCDLCDSSKVMPEPRPWGQPVHVCPPARLMC